MQISFVQRHKKQRATPVRGEGETLRFFRASTWTAVDDFFSQKRFPDFQ
jgi:hypothetical protein